MSNPLYWNTKILLAKMETTYGVDPTPAAATDGILASNVSLTPMQGQDVARDNDLPVMGSDGTIPADLHVTLSFDVELAGSGTAGTAPAWAPLMRGCAMAMTTVPGTSVTFNPISLNHESLTFYIQIGGTLHKIPGARGTCELMIGASAIPKLKFSYTGLYVRPIEQARAIPDLSNFKKPLIGSTRNTPTFTVNGTGFVLREFSLDFGNQVEPRFLIGNEDIRITDREEALSMKVEAVPVSTFDPYALAETAAAVAIAPVAIDAAARGRPKRVSSPAPPARVSSPAPPWMKSSPPRPSMSSPVIVPKTV